MQFVGIFLVEQLQQPSPCRFRHLQSVQQAGDKSHVADFQHGGHVQGRQTLQSQLHNFRLGGRIHGAHTFQAHLVDGLECMAFPAGAANFFIIIEALALTGGRLSRFGNGQRHVRFDGPQLAVQVGKGDHLGIRQKALVFLIQCVFLKPGTTILAIPGPFVQSTQTERCLFRGGKILQLNLHTNSLPLHTYKIIIL